MLNGNLETNGNKGPCQVCQGPAAGLYFGALVCLPCKSFYIRCTKDGVKLRCQQDANACTINKGRFKCQACRFKACLEAGMQRKEEKPEVIQAPAGSSLCKVCGDLANGVHFGVTSCEGCKKFFRRGLSEYQNYVCKDGGNCPINPRTRNQCRYCRYRACATAGMSREAIKVGRPPSKKENSRHHPYSQINLSTGHHETSPKLYSNNYFLKQEVPWIPNGNHSLSSLPALIHGNGVLKTSNGNNKKVSERQLSADLNSSCTSNDINDMLLQYIDPNGEMPPLPAHFDLDETFAQIDSLSEVDVDQRKINTFQRIENLPNQSRSQQQPSAFANSNYQSYEQSNLKSVKDKTNPNTYREPFQMYSHPSPPYETNFDTKNSPASVHFSQRSQVPTIHQQQHHQQNMTSAFSVSTPSNHTNSTPAYMSNNYMSSHAQHGSPTPQNAFEISPRHPLALPHHLASGQGQINQFQSNHPQIVNPNGQPYGDISSNHRHSNSNGEIQQDLNPYGQPVLSPESWTSSESSPHSTTQSTSGYATDSQDFLEEFSIYDPVDIRQVNNKYMPSWSHEPLVFNEKAFTIEDIMSKNQQQPGDCDPTANGDLESTSSEKLGSGMFKRMKSIDDKIKQDYWFEHDMADVKYSDELKKEMKSLTVGWAKCREYIESSLKLSSDDGKESHWPNVKENAPIQLKMWEFIKTRLLRGTTAQVMFYQQIKGNEKVPEKDQKLLVSTSSFSNCLLMHVLYWWDDEREQCKYFWSWKIPPSDPFYVFRQTLLKFSRAIRDLNFDETEIMLVSALTLFSSDIIQIEEKETIDKERKTLTDLCAAYMKDKYNDKYKKRYRDVLTMVPALRYLSIWHHDLMAYAKTFGSVGINLDKMRISEA